MMNLIHVPKLRTRFLDTAMITLFLLIPKCLIPARLYSYISSTPDVDLVFLDIELPGINGATVGNSIRNKLRQNDLQIVYISSKTNYAMQLFEARPFDFLVKPIRTERLTSLFEKYIQIYGNSEIYYEFHHSKADYRIPLSKILYFCCDNKLINVVTDKDIYSHYGSIKAIHGKYEKLGFWSVHNSYIVNIKYSDKITDNEILMCNGDLIPVSRKYKPGKKKDNMAYSAHRSSDLGSK